MVEPNKKLKTIAIITGGSRGDIQPYVAVGLALEEAGYSVSILTNEDHVEFCKKLGLRAVAMFSNARELLQSDPRVLNAMAQGNVTDFLKMLGDINRERAEFSLRNFVNFMRADNKEESNSRIQLFICGSLSEYYAMYAWLFYDIPFIHVHTLVPMYTSKQHASFGFPTLPFGLHYYLLTGILLSALYKLKQSQDERVKQIVASQGHDDVPSKQVGVTDLVSKSAFFRDSIRPLFPHILLQPSLWKTKVYGADTTPSTFKFVGPAILDVSSKSQRSGGTIALHGPDNLLTRQDEIDKFIQADPYRKPVYCGWGSMICKSPPYMVKLVVGALHQSRQRGIVLGGFANLSMDLLIESCANEQDEQHLVDYAWNNVLFVQETNHEVLFPQTSCTIHHGGQGTLAASMRSGVPTIITPVFLDQYDSAHLIQTLGNGIGFKHTQLQKLSAEQLANAITKVVNSTDSSAYKQRAKAIREEMMLDENNGSSNVVLEIQKFWKDVVVGGQLHEHKRQIFSDAGYQVVDGSVEALKTKRMRKIKPTKSLVVLGVASVTIGLVYCMKLRVD